MKNLFRYVISGFCLASILLAATSVFAAPVRLNQVVQVVNAKPGKANSGNFSQLRLVDDLVIKTDDDDTVTATPTQDDDRMIVKKTTEIVEEEVCDCDPIPEPKKKFPYWALGFAAVPLLFLIPGKDKTPTPTTPTTQTPTPTTPTPPEPVPEPMTLLLFGTGLAGIGIAARKKFGKKEQTNTEN